MQNRRVKLEVLQRQSPYAALCTATLSCTIFQNYSERFFCSITWYRTPAQTATKYFAFILIVLMIWGN